MASAEHIFKRYIVPSIVHGVIYSIGLVYAAIFMARYMYRFVRNPKDTFWKVAKRELPPPVLNDPVYGNHSYIQLKNIKLHYVEAGDKSKPLMLFVHGFPEFWYSWRHQIKEFSKDYWTVAIDMRGYGDSEKPPGTKYYKMKYLVDDFKNVIEALGKDQCILVAHDWGGVIGWYFLQAHPNLISKYVFINAPHPLVYRKLLIKSLAQFRKSWYVFFFQIPFVPELFATLKDMAFFKRAFTKGNEEPLLNEEELEAYKFTFGKPGAFTYPINYYRANIIPDWKLLKQTTDDKKPPTGLFLFGDKDMAIEVAVVEKTKRIIHNLTTEIIPGASHFAHADQPDLVNKAIREFVESTS